MDKIFKLKLKIAIVIFAVIDLLCVGLGMGVPIFCVLFGFLVGWYIARRSMIEMKGLKKILRRIMAYAIITWFFTFLMMIFIWGPMILWLFDPQADFKNSGIPLILYEPKLSFIGWLVLMIFISPFLQLLTTIFASYLTLLKQPNKANAESEGEVI